MEQDQEKIKKLEKELEQLAAQLEGYRAELRKLQNDDIRPADQPIAPEKSNRDFPSLQRNASSSQGLENFIGLRLLHLVGIVVLVIGISIGVKYAVDRELISPAARIALAYAAGIVLLGISVKLKRRFQLFSAILFSGAMASLYFTTYAAFVYYQLFPSGLAFGVMVAITFFTSVMALRYDRQEIAILGMIGAYGIPFLISANSDRVDLFFTYIILINAGVVFLSFRKSWKGMVRLAMLASWFLFIAWALTRYNVEMKTEAMMVIATFYLMFSIASLGFAIRSKEPLGLIEIQLFLLNSVLSFTGALLVFTNNSFDSRAATVTGISAIIFGSQALIAKLVLPREKIIFNYLVAFAVTSLVCFVGMKWDGVVVTMLWLFIAVVLFVTGAVTKTGWLRLIAIILTGVTLGKLILVDRHIFTTSQKIIAYISIGVILLLLSFFYQKYKQKLFEKS